jgi:hypothetical protein
MKRSPMQARIGALSYRQNESHLKAGADVATQVTVKNESPKHSTIGDARKTRYRRSLNVAKGNLKYIVYQEETCGVGGVFKGVKCANNITWKLGVGWK